MGMVGKHRRAKDRSFDRGRGGNFWQMEAAKSKNERRVKRPWGRAGIRHMEKAKDRPGQGGKDKLESKGVRLDTLERVG